MSLRAEVCARVEEVTVCGNLTPPRGVIKNAIVDAEFFVVRRPRREKTLRRTMCALATPTS
jgi:hypothetical protein